MKEQKKKPKKAEVKLKAEKKIKKEAEGKIEPVNIVYQGKSKFSLAYWKVKFKDKYFPEKTVLINMELVNGMHTQFLTTIKPDNTFKYKGKKYLVDTESKYFVTDCKLWCYDFHEEFSLPIRRNIPITKLKKTIEHSNITEVEYATNPSTLERFTVSKIAEGIMKGQQIDEFFKRIQLLLIITMLASVIHLIIFAFKSGMLQAIKIPGIIG